MFWRSAARFALGCTALYQLEAPLRSSAALRFAGLRFALGLYRPSIAHFVVLSGSEGRGGRH